MVSLEIRLMRSTLEALAALASAEQTFLCISGHWLATTEEVTGCHLLKLKVVSLSVLVRYLLVDV